MNTREWNHDYTGMEKLSSGSCSVEWKYENGNMRTWKFESWTLEMVKQLHSGTKYGNRNTIK